MKNMQFFMKSLGGEILNLREKLIEELGVKTLFKIGPVAITESVVNTWVLLAIVAVVCLLLTRNLKVENPGKRQLFVETLVEWLQNVTKGMLGEHAIGYAGYIITVMVFIAISDLSAILETRVAEGYTFMKPPTKGLNVTIALALASIVIVETACIFKKGFGGYLKSKTQPIAIITPINILEIAIRPLSLCMRLFGNIFGGFIIMELLKCLVPFAVPIPFSFYFDVFDGLIQAYVFVFLTSIYIGEAVE